MRGRKPLPTKTHELNGNPSRLNLEARKEAEPKPIAGMPPKPAMSTEAGEAWDYVCQHLDSMGILAASDQQAIALLCKNWALLIEAESHLKKEGIIVTVNGQRQRNPWLRVKLETEKPVLKLLSEFGLTPSSRSRIAIQKTNDKPGEALLRFVSGAA